MPVGSNWCLEYPQKPEAVSRKRDDGRKWQTQNAQQLYQIVMLVLRQAAWMLVLGSGIGLIGAYFGANVLRTLLYQVKAYDPWTMVLVTLVLIGSGLAAACIPARRAAGIDPMQALRSE